jgi:hypothetical protein
VRARCRRGSRRKIGRIRALPPIAAPLPARQRARSPPAVTRAAETGIRSGGGLLARLAASPLARAATGLPGVVASLVFDAGDRPVGTDAASTARRQSEFAQQYREQINRQAGYELIKGQNAAEIIESIARYRSRR